MDSRVAAIIFSLCCIGTAIFILTFRLNYSLDLCYLESPAKVSFDFRKVAIPFHMFFIGFYCFKFFDSNSKERKKKGIQSFFNIRNLLFAVISVFYFNFTYFGLAILREQFPDSNCSHPGKTISNSISGHYYMYTFSTLITLLFLTGKKELPKKPMDILKFVLGITDCLMALSVMTTTYFGGYHTIRQMLSGMFLAFGSFAIFVAIIIPSLKRTKRSRIVSLIIQLALFCITLSINHFVIGRIPVVHTTVALCIVFWLLSFYMSTRFPISNM